MIKFSEDFEKRRDKVNALIKDLKDKEDKNILESIYCVSNIEDNHYDEEKLSKVNMTYFTGIEMKELLGQFMKEVFNTKGEKYYEELFQEVYNRQTKDNGYEPRYLVEVSGTAATTNGFMRHGTNMLNINAGMIEKYKNIDMYSDKTDAKNANTIGAHSLLTLIHETQHTFQSEGMMKFALNEDLEDKHDRARNAICLARFSLLNYMGSEKFDKSTEEGEELYDLMKNNYWFDYMEHDSNMAPVKFLNKQIKNKNLPNGVFIKAGKQRVVNDIHINKVASEEEIPSTLKTRAEKMEAVVNGYYKYFSKLMEDGEIKQSVCKEMEAYLKPDEKGQSQFNKDLNKDFKMCLNFIEFAKNHTVSDKSSNENNEDKTEKKDLNKMQYKLKLVNNNNEDENNLTNL